MRQVGQGLGKLGIAIKADGADHETLTPRRPPGLAGFFSLGGRLGDLRTVVIVDYQNVHLVGHGLYESTRNLPNLDSRSRSSPEVTSPSG